MTGMPARPAVYVRDSADRETVIGLVRELGWPVPTVFADAGEPGSELTALVEAISAGRHDAVFATHPMMIASDLGEIEAFDRLCRQRGVRVRYRWAGGPRDPRALFDIIEHARRFTVTDEHLRLLRRARVSWDESEYGAPGINPKRPYGNSNVLADIAEILEVPDSEWMDAYEDPIPDAEWRFLRLHVEAAVALQIGLATGEFRSGQYMRGNEWDSSWMRDDSGISTQPGDA
jgi:hypothetical protein